nr:reverse transcriptase domain-containing protein [Tanacetum cinerariifolium]
MWSDQEKRVQKIDHLARSILIQGIPNDIYSLIDSNKTAKDLWDALVRHMLGSEYGEQDRKAAVLYGYETFKATEGELLLDAYIQYLQVINDLKKCGYSKDNCDKKENPKVIAPRMFKFFPPSKTTNLLNEITRFQQRFDESFYEAWDRFNDLVRACPHHEFSELHQLDTFYNGLNVNDQDSLNSAAGGNFLEKMPRECLKIIESKSKVRQSRAKAVVAKVSTISSTPAISSEVSELKDMVRALLLDKKNQFSVPASSATPAPVIAIEPNCSGTLPSNTITNFKEDLKGMTTRSGAAYQGPSIPTPSKVMKQGTENTKDQVQTPNSQCTAPVQPPVIQSETQTLVSEPVVAPVSVLMPNLKPYIPYPLRRDNERRRDQANEQIEKFYEIFKEMSFEISFTDALILLPKFASTLKALIGNKEKLSAMARTLMNEHCSAVILNKLLRKLGDPCKFLIPCEFPGMDEYLALADLGGSINLMPLSVWEGLSLPELTLTCMTLELADRSVSKPIEVLGFSDVTASGNPTPYEDPIVSTNSPTITPFGDSDFLLFAEADAFLGLEDDPNSLEFNPFYYDPEGEILLLEAILNTKNVKSFVDKPPEVELKDLPPHLEYAFLEGNNKLPIIIAKELGDEEKSALIKVSPVHCVPKKGGFTVVENKENELILTRLVTGWRVCIDYRKLNKATRKDHFPLSFMDQMLERLTGNEYYCFLNGFFEYFQIPIDPRDQEKTTFTCPYGMFAYRRMPFGLYNAPGTFQRCMLAIFHDMVEKTMEVFMDDFSVFGNSFENCLSRLDKMLQRYEDTNLSLNWEKSHFMVKEGIVLGHNISKNVIEVDRAKVDVIAKLPHPTTVKDAKARLLWWVLLLEEFDFKVLDTKGAENLTADHLSRLENPYENVLDPKEINETFPLETLSMVTFRGDSSSPWFADFANYHAGNFIVKVCEIFDVWGIDLMGPFPSSRGNKYILMVVDYLSKWVEAKALPTNDDRVVCKFLKSLFARFGSPRAIISDRKTHFCNDQFAKVTLKYGVTHRLSTVYHPQTSGQVEVSNHGLKRILERTIGKNRASWIARIVKSLMLSVFVFHSQELHILSFILGIHSVNAILHHSIGGMANVLLWAILTKLEGKKIGGVQRSTLMVLEFSISSLPQHISLKFNWKVFPHISVVCLDRHLSDHRPILLREKLQVLKKEIRKWIADRKKTQISNVQNIRSKLRDIDKSLEQGEANDDLLASRMEFLNQLHNFKTAETSEYIQKAKIKWAVEGDKNSKFFHGMVNWKRANLTVKGVMIDDEWVDEPNRVKEEFHDYFAARFNEPDTRHGHINYIFPNRLNEEQVADLETPITRDEIRLAVWGCEENKSPSPDEFTFEFFRKFWVVVGPHFCTAVEWFFDHASFPIRCNSSFIALIPKSLEPKTVGDYRPITLIGCLYKVVTKILATRLSSVISDLVSDVQTAFLPNRKILDGPFFINELLARCRYKKQRAMIFKVDFAKAYDSIRWDYLEAVLNSFGFGLKQGDPLASYLFILIMESLHLSLYRVIEAGVFTGMMRIQEFTNFTELGVIKALKYHTIAGHTSLMRFHSVLQSARFSSVDEDDNEQVANHILKRSWAMLLGIGPALRVVHYPRPEKTMNDTRRVVRTGPTKLCFNKLAPFVGPRINYASCSHIMETTRNELF